MNKKNLARGLGLAFLGGVAFFGTKWYNTERNHKIVVSPYYVMNTYDIGFFGRIRHTRFEKDGLVSVEVYPKTHYRVFGHQVYEDFNEDEETDEILIVSPEAKKYDRKIIKRNHDYYTHKEIFDNADKLLKKLSEKYPPRK